MGDGGNGMSLRLVWSRPQPLQERRRQRDWPRDLPRTGGDNFFPWPSADAARRRRRELLGTLDDPDPPRAA